MSDSREKSVAEVATAIGSDRQMPSDVKLEQAALSAMLREPSPCVDIALSTFGRDPNLFYSHVHREIFMTIVALHDGKDSNVDTVAVAHELTRKGNFEELGGEVALAEIYCAIASTANLEAWCINLRELFTLRRMIGVCQESMIRCFAPEAEAKSLVEEVESAIYNIRNTESRSEVVQIRDQIRAQFEYLQNIIKGSIEVGIPSGYSALDAYTGGLKPGEMFVLAARPSIGKTSIALNIIRNIVLHSSGNKRYKVAFFSLEMTAEQITRRLLCTEAGVSENSFWNKSFKDSDMVRLTQAVTAFKNAHLYIDPTGGLTVAELRAKARRLHRTVTENGEPGIDLIEIDYLQLMHADVRASDGRQNEVAAISSGIKALAKDLNVPVLVLAQLNREIEKSAGANSRPKLSHLRESGAIEQDADIVTFLHRDREQAKDIKSPDVSVEAELIVEKNRNGETGIVKLNFFPAKMLFTAASPYRDDECPPETKR